VSDDKYPLQQLLQQLQQQLLQPVAISGIANTQTFTFTFYVSDILYNSFATTPYATPPFVPSPTFLLTDMPLVAVSAAARIVQPGDESLYEVDAIVVS